MDLLTLRLVLPGSGKAKQQGSPPGTKWQSRISNTDGWVRKTGQGSLKSGQGRLAMGCHQVPEASVVTCGMGEGLEYGNHYVIKTLILC